MPRNLKQPYSWLEKLEGMIIIMHCFKAKQLRRLDTVLEIVQAIKDVVTVIFFF